MQCAGAAASQQLQEPPQQQKIQHWLEGTVDSSRYFTLKIVNPVDPRREATIGFGFRERDSAVDLRESIQHYETAMRREHEAAILATLNASADAASASSSSSAPHKYTIPKLAEGEKIHIHTGKLSNSNSSGKPKKDKEANNNKSGGLPLLLKKPPPSPESAAKQAIRLVGSVTLDDDSIVDTIDDETGDDDDWDTEFVSAN